MPRKTPPPESLTREEKLRVVAWKNRRFPWILDRELADLWDDFRIRCEANADTYANHEAAFKTHIKNAVVWEEIRKPAEALGSSPPPPEPAWERRQRLERERTRENFLTWWNGLTPIEQKAHRETLREGLREAGVKVG